MRKKLLRRALLMHRALMHKHQLGANIAGPRVTHEVVDAQSILGLIAAGFGVGLVPASIARFTTKEIQFLPLASSSSSLSADVYMVCRQDDQAPALRNFIAFADGLPGPKTGGACGGSCSREMAMLICRAMRAVAFDMCWPVLYGTVDRQQRVVTNA
jgi:hypothetical protein